jgi:hypothetical protein
VGAGSPFLVSVFPRPTQRRRLLNRLNRGAGPGGGRVQPTIYCRVPRQYRTFHRTTLRLVCLRRSPIVFISSMAAAPPAEHCICAAPGGVAAERRISGDSSYSRVVAKQRAVEVSKQVIRKLIRPSIDDKRCLWALGAINRVFRRSGSSPHGVTRLLRIRALVPRIHFLYCLPAGCLRN